MSPLINISVDNLMTLFKERCESGKGFDIHRYINLSLSFKAMQPSKNKILIGNFKYICTYYPKFNVVANKIYFRAWQSMTLETIASCAFGIDVNSVKNPDSPFLKNCRAFFEGSENVKPLAKIMTLLVCKLIIIASSLCDRQTS